MKVSKYLAISLLSSGLLLTSCLNKGSKASSSNDGSTNSVSATIDASSSRTEEGWTEITSSQFGQEYSNKQSAPWNHFEGTFGGGTFDRDSDGNPILYPVVENLVSSTWQVDESSSEEGMIDISASMIITSDEVSTYLNPPPNMTVTFKKKDNNYQLNIHSITSGYTQDVFFELDKYFYATDQVVKSDANTSKKYRVESEAHITWSTK